MKRFVVTFARGFGSGGKEIASLLARDLGIHCYENRILTLASQMSGLDERLFQEVNEKVRENGGVCQLHAWPSPGAKLYRAHRALCLG